MNKYKNTYHITIKMKPADVKSGICLTLIKKVIRKVLNVKLLIMWEYRNIKGYVPNWSEETFVIKSVLWTYVISDLSIREVVGTF